MLTGDACEPGQTVTDVCESWLRQCWCPKLAQAVGPGGGPPTPRANSHRHLRASARGGRQGERPLARPLCRPNGPPHPPGQQSQTSASVGPGAGVPPPGPTAESENQATRADQSIEQLIRHVLTAGGLEETGGNWSKLQRGLQLEQAQPKWQPEQAPARMADGARTMQLAAYFPFSPKAMLADSVCKLLSACRPWPRWSPVLVVA